MLRASIFFVACALAHSKEVSLESSRQPLLNRYYSNGVLDYDGSDWPGNQDNWHEWSVLNGVPSEHQHVEDFSLIPPYIISGPPAKLSYKLHLPEPYTQQQIPPYFESLISYNLLVSKVQEILNSPAPKSNDFVILAGTIDGLTSTMTHVAWKYYDQKFDSLAPEYFNEAVKSPAAAINRLNCVIDAANRSTDKIRRILSDNQLNRICSTDKSCDALVGTLIRKGGKDLLKEAQILIALGQFADLTLNKYAQVFQDHGSNIYMLVVSNKDYWKPLIHAGRQARVLISDRCHSKSFSYGNLFKTSLV